MKGKIKSFLFDNTSAQQTIAKNTFWLSMSHVVGRLIKAGLLIYAARLIGAEGYGIFSYALSLSIIFYIFSDIGIGALLTRQISSTGKIQKEYVSTSLFIKFGLILLSALAVVLTGPFLAKIPEVTGLLPIIALLIALDGIRDFMLAINRGKEKMEIEAALHVATNVAIVLAGLGALALYGTPKSLLSAYTIGSGFGLIVTLSALGKYLRGIWNSFEKTLVKKIVQEAWPFALLGLLGVVMINTDIIMLGFFRSAGEVGLYSAAQKPIQVIYVIPAIFAAAFLPTVTKFVNKENQRVRKLLEKTIAAVLLIGFPLALGGIAVGRKLMNLLFGGEYLGATLSFQILLVTVLIVFPSVIIASAVFAYNKQKSFIGFLLLGALGNVVFNIFLIPKYGIDGSAVATIGAELTANTFIWLKMKKLNHFAVLPHLRKIIPSALIMTASTIIMQAVGIPLAVNIAASAVVYFLLLKLLKEPMLKEAANIIMKSEL